MSTNVIAMVMRSQCGRKYAKSRMTMRRSNALPAGCLPKSRMAPRGPMFEPEEPIEMLIDIQTRTIDDDTAVSASFTVHLFLVVVGDKSLCRAQMCVKAAHVCRMWRYVHVPAQES